ncbi:MAG: aspartate-semialdehyde dehydrogenase [Rhodospirillaceae bacterium]|nr:aspartate-semialdehyde dehydrogenase [Rhodospirillaceae bacterium]
MGYRVAVAGATGAVGREMLSILAERQFPADEVIPLASERSAGKTVDFAGKKLTVKDLATFDFKGVDIGLFSPGAKISAVQAPRAAAAGCIVIDNTSQFRYDPEIPLVVPEVNAHAIAGYGKKGIIANPNCSTAQMVVALKPLHELAGIKRVVVATYQATGGAGQAGMAELEAQSKALAAGQPAERKKFTKQIAFNLIPHIDVFMEDGATKEEWKMVQETKKILDPSIEVIATCVRVPVYVGHSEAVFIECERPLSVEAARAALEKAPGITVVDQRQDGGYITPLECAGKDPVYISRIRQDATVPHGLAFWCVSDNLRKGAALNAVQIAEEVVRRHLGKAKAA